jgi:ABC-type antimicrobial peptide transport system permease subunit
VAFSVLNALGMNDSVGNMRIINGITDGLKIVLKIIGTVTLTIGGMGVVNIMPVSVTERTREIGVRKAIDASRHNLTQLIVPLAKAVEAAAVA